MKLEKKVIWETLLWLNKIERKREGGSTAIEGDVKSWWEREREKRMIRREIKKKGDKKVLKRDKTSPQAKKGKGFGLVARDEVYT